MPELPEVETVKQGLAPAMEGATIVKVTQRRKDLRFPLPPDFAGRLTGCQIRALSRRAKYLLADLDSGETLVMHLGMSGSFRIEDAGEGETPGKFTHPRSADEKHDHIVFHLSKEGRRRVVVYNDPRRFGYMDLIHSGQLNTHPWFRNLGLEPTGNSLNGDAMAGMFIHKSAPLKSVLLDQRLIAGLGNIYVCEALWRSRLSPTRKAGTLVLKSGKPSARLHALAEAVRATIRDAISAGGSSLRDYRQTDGSLGYFQHAFCVYGREGEPCKRSGCQSTIKRRVQSGRSTFYCPSCQR